MRSFALEQHPEICQSAVNVRLHTSSVPMRLLLVCCIILFQGNPRLMGWGLLPVLLDMAYLAILEPRKCELH